MSCKRPTHAGWPRIDGADGRVEHSELGFGDGLIMVGSAGDPTRPTRAFCKSPRGLNGAHRSYHAVDLEGHHWWFMRQVRGPTAK